MIDLETAMDSLDLDGRGTSSAGVDVGRFVESIRMNNNAKRLGLSATDMDSIEQSFVKTYAESAGIDPKALAADVDFYRTKMTVTAMKYAKSQADFDAFLAHASAR